ncbi:unnamed protein product [Pieris macdunnoughi]|uniref:Uncharacterized protein n=1 Tax=Pieris macdunnoughi TaxID=345717 RepID=A0A821WKI0_9NEOP|nr:unnamed protein product [Pieris macdunnoughi]
MSLKIILFPSYIECLLITISTKNFNTTKPQSDIKNIAQTDISQETILDYTFGNNTNDIEFPLLESDRLKDITRTAIAQRRSKTRWEISDAAPNEKYTAKALELMQQHIYATRYRLEETRKYRLKYRNDAAYQTAIYYGAVLEIRYKLDRLYNTMKNFKDKTKFIWYLVIYERIVQAHVDVDDMVERIFSLRKKFKGKHDEEAEDDEYQEIEPVGEPDIRIVEDLPH